MGSGVRVRVIVKGIVQGVGFRSFIRRHATALGLTGYVRNLPDGESVEIVVSGPEDRVNELIKLAKRGPPAAVVDSVEVEPYEGVEDFTGFSVRYD
ncbi:acylphosphatase [Caldivirga maquilingensis]|uniref:Acylphosphatase n=1 Tax=Caldivirga maquilingensis (strain ATCC 700844 / DSM 13496 / JCM 10307 / IC-167) TaxID=397948 RepID=ACYP_CALMQ|nr:acylphosphatase [Caldivirga maquilingensis]A8MC09.1 RecName: Full=Acylphosphatase; AltName: Full=Acylphosphate phosphohydrolase [Caldivirga maquilingensis IC-167]ABW02793.1 acylphosphatase [Caldivirga maquilingensis IC-167]